MHRRLPEIVGQAAEVPVPRQDLAIRGGEEAVGIKEKGQLSHGPDEDLAGQEPADPANLDPGVRVTKLDAVAMAGAVRISGGSGTVSRTGGIVFFFNAEIMRTEEPPEKRNQVAAFTTSMCSHRQETHIDDTIFLAVAGWLVKSPQKQVVVVCCCHPSLHQVNN